MAGTRAYLGSFAIQAREVPKNALDWDWALFLD